MFYSITITSEDDKVINLGDKDSDQNTDVTEVKIHLDTTDDSARQKSLVMLAKVKICGKIVEDSKSVYKALFDWAKSLDKNQWYREVVIEIKIDSNTVYRTYRFEKMFVVDYKEFYGNSNVDSEYGTFELDLTQKENLFKTIENY